MPNINPLLKEYIEKNVLPEYKKNESGHGIEHIKYVTKRCFKFANQFPNIDLDMIYTIASFHDIAHHIDKDNHETLSAKYFEADKNMEKFFDNKQRKIIKEAIEDHRASSNHEPRSDYGKIISSADRSTDIDSILKRTYSYSLKHYPDLTLYQSIERSYKHIQNKYGTDGYAKHYCKDEEYEQFRKDVESLLKDKWLFIKRHLEINKILDIKEMAKIFAILAHKGQVRKSEPDKPMIMHPISVGMILEEYGCEDSVIAAGYLHDVVEDTKYTIDDIEKEFGKEIAELVMAASESDKSLPWEERKKETIEKTKTLPLKKKFVICADKINNLEDLGNKFAKSGKRDFSNFNRGEEQQKWYYTNIYKSLIYGEDKNLPIFIRLKDALDSVFSPKEDSYLKDTIFNDNKKYYEKLKKLQAQKIELQRLKKLAPLSKPYCIEFSGTPRTGKTTTINNLYDFFKKGGFKTTIIEEFTTSKYYKEVFKPKFNDVTSTESNMAIIEEVTKELENAIKSDKEIIIIDRSINDRQIWNYRRFINKQMPKKLYCEAREKYKLKSKELIDFLVITYADPIASLKRDYNSSLALEERHFLNIDNLNEYNNSLNDLKDLFEESVNDSLFLDTTKLKMNDVAIKVAEKIMKAMREKYINSFKEYYKI